jgi:MIP family channel proteins
MLTGRIEMSEQYVSKKCASEFIGTFALVFFGCGAVAVDQLSNGALGLIGISVVFGLVVMAMVYTYGHASGAHINPAVTIALAFSKRFDKKDVLPYVGAQCAGAVSASLVHLFLLKSVFLEQGILEKMAFGVTQPINDSSLTVVFVEALLTFFLMVVILGSAVDKKAAGNFAGIAIGATVAFLIMFGGPITGGSLNPARSLGPAIVSGELSHIVAYVIGPIIGAIGAVVVYDKLNTLDRQTNQELGVEPDLAVSKN